MLFLINWQFKTVRPKAYIISLTGGMLACYKYL